MKSLGPLPSRDEKEALDGASPSLSSSNVVVGSSSLVVEHQHGCLLRLNGHVSVASGGGVLISWPTEVYDPTGMHDPMVLERITVTQPGLYMVVFSVALDALASGCIWDVEIRKDASSTVIAMTTWNDTVNAGNMHIAALDVAASGTYYRAHIRHTDSVSRNLYNVDRTWFGASLFARS